eukprot:SAG22_NODE_61_length_23387_cov_34.380582_19_plen_90_part_00
MEGVEGVGWPTAALHCAAEARTGQQPEHRGLLGVAVAEAGPERLDNLLQPSHVCRGEPVAVALQEESVRPGDGASKGGDTAGEHSEIYG